MLLGNSHLVFDKLLTLFNEACLYLLILEINLPSINLSTKYDKLCILSFEEVEDI